MKLQRIAIPLSAFLLAACGPGGLKFKNDSRGAGGENDKLSCPPIGSLPDYQINIHTHSALPKKLMLMTAGLEKINACTNQPKDGRAAPAMVFERGDGALTVRAIFDSSGLNLPASAGFQIYELGDCRTSPRPYYAVVDLPLTYKTEEPSGPDCPAKTSAKADLYKD